MPDRSHKKTEPKTASLGIAGEKVAEEYLVSLGMRIICINFRAPVGRNRRGVQITGEIDIIALEGETVVFLEVKTRSSDSFAGPESAVDLRKQRQIIRAAKAYRKIFRPANVSFRYDVVGVVMREGSKPIVKHFRAYWSEDKFRKAGWEALPLFSGI